MRARVEIDFFDTTLRDGAQSLPEANQFPDGSKVEIAGYIADLGVDVIEAGFPKTPGDAEEVQAVANEVGNRPRPVTVWQNGQVYIPKIDTLPVIAGLCRTIPEDIAVTWDSVKNARRPRIHTFVSTDNEHMRAKFPGKTRTQVLEIGRSAVILARELTRSNKNATVEFSAEAASTTDILYLEDVIRAAINAGADVINLPDTVGQRDPFWMKTFYSRAIGWIMSENSDVILSAHNHNDRDMATANTMAMIYAAIEYAKKNQRLVKLQVEATICGLGERAGNTDIFPVAASLYKDTTENSVDVQWAFNRDQSVTVATKVLGLAGLDVPRQSPIVGEDTNVHRSGIHSDGVIKGGHEIYTPHDPKYWGHSESARHEEGKYQGASGRHAINNT
jgi:2-isopropylmalate synthase